MGLWILIGLNIITKVYGYSNGNFLEVCESMLPAHKRINSPPFPPQNTKPPCDLFHKLGNEGDPITVFLQSKASTKFMGFMLEALKRTNGTIIEGHPVGQFILLGSYPAQLLSCHGSPGTAVSQRNNQRKNLFQVNWTAPVADVDITFRATFLETFKTFWIKVDNNLDFPHHTTPTPSTEPSTTTSTETNMTTQQGAVIFNLLEGAGIVGMNVNSFFVVLNMELSNMFITVLSNSPFSHRLSKASQISCSLLCAAVEISSVVLFCVADPIKVTLVALVCVAIVIHFIKLVIVCLPIEISHELKDIRDHAVRVCSVIHLIFTIAVIFVGVLEIDSCRMNRTDSWLLKVMITFTVWIFLFVIWVFVSSAERNAILGRSKTGRQQNNNKEKKLSGARGIFTAVSVIYIFGSLCFAVAIAVGIFGCQQE